MGIKQNTAIAAVAAPIISVLGVVVVLFITGMVAFEWLIRQGIQQFLAQMNW